MTENKPQRALDDALRTLLDDVERDIDRVITGREVPHLMEQQIRGIFAAYRAVISLCTLK
jgi:hypothetical protein